jgi:integrase
VLADEEIRFVMETDAPAGSTLRFLLATGLRISEAYEGSRDGQYWVVPAQAAKNGKEHRVFLSPVTLAQLEHFPWALRRQRLQTWVLKNGTGWTCHDLRRTFATRTNAMGVAPHIVERMLNHTLPGLMETYNRADYAPERQEAPETWSKYLMRFVGATAGENIVPLRANAPQAA